MDERSVAGEIIAGIESIGGDSDSDNETLISFFHRIILRHQHRFSSGGENIPLNA